MIPPSLASFLHEGLALHVGTRDARMRPVGGRGLALFVEPDGRHLTVHIPTAAAERLMPELDSHGQIAISIGRPMDERACQLKGTVVATRVSGDDEQRLVEAQLENYLAQLEMIGIPRTMAAGWSRWPCVAVRVKVTAVFEQTPGAHAGHAIA